MKNNIIKILEKYEYKLVENAPVENTGFALIFEGPILCNTKYSEMFQELSVISEELEVMMFQVDDNTVLFAVFAESLELLK